MKYFTVSKMHQFVCLWQQGQHVDVVGHFMSHNPLSTALSESTLCNVSIDSTDFLCNCRIQCSCTLGRWRCSCIRCPSSEGPECLTQTPFDLHVHLELSERSEIGSTSVDRRGQSSPAGRARLKDEVVCIAWWRAKTQHPARKPPTAAA
jgi:hypothetical protein